jgi:hypothetical protein
MTRAIVVVAAALAILSAGCGAVVSSGQSTPNTHETPTAVATASSLADMRNRPLKLPKVGAGQTCPTTASHDLRPVVNGGKGKGPGFGFGPGPAYLSGIIELYPGGFDNEVWLIEPTYEGPVLIRGQQINGSGIVTFAEPITFPVSGFSNAGSPPPGAAVTTVTIGGQAVPFYKELDLPAMSSTDVKGFWRMFFARTHIEAAGCYAFQLDGLDFSLAIVFQVPDAARPPA